MAELPQTNAQTDCNHEFTNKENGWTPRKLSTQIAGHTHDKGGGKDDGDDVLDLGNGIVMKPLQPPPRGPRELQFYQRVFDPSCVDADLLELRQFIPCYMGSWIKDNVTYLKMKNLTYKFKYPCVVDFKMGKVTYDPDASAEKIEKENAKQSEDMRNLGFKPTGMMVQNADPDSLKKHDKYYCRNLTEKTLLSDGLRIFFSMLSGERKKKAMQQLHSRLKKLESWFSKQRKFSFIASSILIVYEGAVKKTKESPVVEVPLDSVHGKNYNHANNGGVNVSVNKETVCLQNNEHLESSEICNPYSPNNSPLVDSSSKQIMTMYNSDASNIENEPNQQLCYRNDTENMKLKDESVDIEEPLIEAHLIDFAHAFPCVELDDNFLIGLQNLIAYLGQV